VLLIYPSFSALTLFIGQNKGHSIPVLGSSLFWQLASRLAQEKISQSSCQTKAMCVFAHDFHTLHLLLIITLS